MSIRLRLTLWYTSILALMLIVFGLSLYYSLSYMSMNNYKDDLRAQVQQVGQRLDYTVLLSGRGVNLAIELDRVDSLLTEGIYLQVVNLTSREVSRSSNAQEAGVVIPISNEQLKQIEKRNAVDQVIDIQNYPFLTYSKAIVINGETVGILSGAVLVKNHYDFLHSARNLLLVLSAAVVIAAASIGWFLARKALRPIDLVIEAADRIERGDDLDNRILYDGPKDEIGRLIGKINGMLGRIEKAYSDLEGAYRAQRRFVSDASHELRTPLTTIRGNVELLNKMLASRKQSADNAQSEEELRELLTETLADISAESDRMTRLVNDLLSLARADAGFVMHKEHVALSGIVESAVKRAGFLPKSADFETGDVAPLAGVRVYGNPDYLLQMLLIFLENAFKYTPQGTVTLSAARDGNRVGIVVEDTGIGMDKDEIPHIFDRFYRADVSRGMTAGTGLGLSIAKWIIDEHQGTVDVRTAKHAGTRFTIWLPVSETLPAEAL